MPTIKTGTLFRHYQLKRDSVNADDRTVNLSFSSELPYERWFGTEILDHGNSAIRLGRLENAGPVLVDHNMSDHVGVIESVSIDGDRVGRAVVRFGKSARASEILDDIKDGIRQHVSVGYVVHKFKREETSERSEDDAVFRAVDWEPLEVSIVSVPADPTVGVNRNADFLTEVEEYEVKVMTETTKTEQVAEPVAAPPSVDVKEVTSKAVKAEQYRVAEIQATGRAYNLRELADEYIANGKSIDAFNRAALERMGSSEPIPVPENAADIGLTDKEVREYSFIRVLNALANPTDRRAQDAAAYELEVSAAAAERLNREARGIVVPMDVLRRDLLVGTDTAGGHTVATNLLADRFIDSLENAMAVQGIGATMLTGLTGNIAIPRQTGGATAYWVAENAAPTESQQAFDQVTMSPTTVGAFTDYSRRLLIQSSIDIEAFVRRDLALRLALAIDLAAINGSGASNQPEGILNVTGIGSVAIGANGGAPTWAHVVDLETEVAIDNADIGSLAYLTNAAVRGTLKQTEKASGTAQFVWDDGMLNGYNAAVSNQVPSNLTKGSGTDLSAIIFGNWSDLLIGMWGGLDLMADPYTGSTAGTVRIVALQDVDVAVRHPESFAAVVDAVTT